MIVSTPAASPRRFNHLKRAIGRVSQRMLTLTLRNLERDGLVSRTVTRRYLRCVRTRFAALRARQ